MPTFDHGIPAFGRLITTPYGLATVRSFHENGTVDIYVGSGRTFTVPGSTHWQEAARRQGYYSDSASVAE